MSVELRHNVGLRPYTWWKMGGPADHFVLPTSMDQLRECLLIATKNHWPVTVLGGGSNVLVSDDGIPGLVVGMKELKGIRTWKAEGRLFIDALAGTPKADVTKIFLSERLSPALFLCGLPGDVGGGVVMNAGVKEQIVPREFVEIVSRVSVIEAKGSQILEKEFSNADIAWSYRHTDGWQPGVIASVQLSWPLTPDPTIMAQVKEATRSRLKRQPLEFPSCGSVFKNPEGNSAGALIEQAGLKGFAMGGLQISEKHANFIVNKNADGFAKDARALIEHVQTVVHKKFGVYLETEVQFLGRW